VVRFGGMFGVLDRGVDGLEEGQFVGGYVVKRYFGDGFPVGTRKTFDASEGENVSWGA